MARDEPGHDSFISVTIGLDPAGPCRADALQRRVSYQRMIRALVDTYAERQANGRK
jgi:hypothetical protein